MIDYQLNTRLNGNLAMTFCFHENKALQQDTTLYKFIWVRSGKDSDSMPCSRGQAITVPFSTPRACIGR